MSGISEIDIRDWNNLDIPKAKASADKLKNRVWPYTHEYNEVVEQLTKFVEAVDLLSRNGVKQVPALFKPVKTTLDMDKE